MTTLVVAFGNPDRGDDGVGRSVAELVGDLDVVIVNGDPLEVLDCWTEYDRVVIVDAMRSDRAVGEVAWHRDDDGPLRPGQFASSHSLGPVELVELARALDRLPPAVEIVGIEAGSMEQGAPLSAPVAAAARRVAEELTGA